MNEQEIQSMAEQLGMKKVDEFLYSYPCTQDGVEGTSQVCLASFYRINDSDEMLKEREKLKKRLKESQT